MRSVVVAMQQYHLEDVELVLLMEDEPGAYDVVIPLGKIRPLRWGSENALKRGETHQGGSEISD
jgi:hypothetical protein